MTLTFLTSDLKNLCSNGHSRDEYFGGKFHWIPSTNYRDIAPREIGVNGRTTDGRTDEWTSVEHDASRHIDLLLAVEA